VTLGGSGGGSLSGSVTIPGLGDQYISNVSLLLSLDGNLTDRSNSPKTVTAIGNAAATGSAKFGSASLSLDGVGDGLQIAGLPVGTEDFTVELWVRKTSSWTAETGNRYLFDYADSDSNLSGGFQVYLNGSSGVLRCSRFGVGVVLDYNISSLTANTWYHFAYVRSGTTVTLYRDGSSVASATGFSGSFGSPATGLQSIGIGSYQGSFQSASSWDGQIDEVRITRGVARTISAAPTAAYPTDLTLPVTITGSGGGGSGLSWSSVPASATASGEPGQIAYDTLGNFYICTATNTWVRSSLAAWETDPSSASVSLLLNMEGAGSTFVDYSSSPKTITAYHGATQSTAAPKFGSKSLYLNGTTFGAGPYLSVPYSSAFDLSTGDWTVECWAYATALNASNNLFAINGDGSSYAQVAVVPQANGSAYFLTQGAGGDWLDTTLSAAGTFTTNTWQHVAAVRAGNVFRLYVNGISVVSFTSSSALMNASGLSTIGARLPAGNSTVGSQTWQGYVDEFRVTKGVARYSGSTIAVPTAAFPNPEPVPAGSGSSSSTPPLSLAGTRPSNLASGNTSNGYTLTGTGASGSPSVLRIGGGQSADLRVWLLVNQTGTLNWTVTASSEEGYDGGRLYSHTGPANYTGIGFNASPPAGYTAISNWRSGTQTQTGTTSVTAGQHIVLQWANDSEEAVGDNRIELSAYIS
jgi:hypothetical protein